MAPQYLVLFTYWFLVLHRCLARADQPVVYFPPFELRAVSGDSPPFLVPVDNQALQAMPKDLESRPERVLHVSKQPTTEVDDQSTSTGEKSTEVHNSSVHELLHALGLGEEKDSRAAARDYDYQPYPHQPSYGYPSRPSYGSPPQPSYVSPPGYPGSYGPYAPPNLYHEPPYAVVPPAVAKHSPAEVKPLLKPLVDKLPDLVKPIATKVAGKFSGLIGLVLNLFTGSITGNTELGGLMDLVINGIVKPLLAAKGGLKSLISKMTIPLISLLLINLEVLITVWWLWEDCDKVHVLPPPAPYPYPRPAYNNILYR